MLGLRHLHWAPGIWVGFKMLELQSMRMLVSDDESLITTLIDDIGVVLWQWVPMGWWGLFFARKCRDSMARASVMSGVWSFLPWMTWASCYSSTLANGSTPQQGITDLLEEWWTFVNISNSETNRVPSLSLSSQCPSSSCHHLLTPYPHLPGTSTVPITCPWQFSIFIVLSIIKSLLLIIKYHCGQGSSDGQSCCHWWGCMLLIRPKSI